MPNFDVDDKLTAIVWKLAKPKPFEQLTFNEALWRIIKEIVSEDGETSHWLDLRRAERNAAVHLADVGIAAGRRLSSPRPSAWVAEVPELKKYRHLTTWKAICDHLGIDTGFDSARRKLRQWVRDNKPDWPPVPDVEPGVAGGAEE